MAVGVSACHDGGGDSLDANAQESLGLGCRQNGVDRGLHTAIRAVLEAKGHRKAGCHLPVGLRFGGPRANRAPTEEVGDVLRSDGIEQLRGRRQPEIKHGAQEGAGEPEAFSDVVRTIQARIHDESLPADRRAWFLEVHAHDDQHAIRNLPRKPGQSPAILLTGSEVMNRARPDDQKDAMVVSKDEIVNFLPGTGDEFGLRGGLWQPSEEFVWRRQDTSLDDIDVGRSLHGGGKLW